MSLNASSFGDHSPLSFKEIIGASWLQDELVALSNSVTEKPTSNTPVDQKLPFHWSSAREEPSIIPLQAFSKGSIRFRGKLKSHSSFVNAKGTLRLHLRTFPSSEAFSSTVAASQVVYITFIPMSRTRTTGIYAVISRIFDRLSVPRLARHIETFNVVPHDSAVIRSVSRNDVRAVQSLFDRGEASPLDVDPNGFSLLSVSHCTLITVPLCSS